MLTLIAQGRTNREVADELFLSPNSIKTYVRTAYRGVGGTPAARRRSAGRSATDSPPTGTEARVH